MKECKSIKCSRVLGIVPGSKPTLSRFFCDFCDVCHVRKNSWRLPVVNKETLKVFLQEVVLSCEVKCWLLFVFKVLLFLTLPSLGGEIAGGFYISSWSFSDIFIMSIYFIYVHNSAAKALAELALVWLCCDPPPCRPLPV